jgi:hypothetical protein
MPVLLVSALELELDARWEAADVSEARPAHVVELAVVASPQGL